MVPSTPAPCLLFSSEHKAFVNAGLIGVPPETGECREEVAILSRDDNHHRLPEVVHALVLERKHVDDFSCVLDRRTFP